MTWIDLLLLLVIAGVCGAVAQAIVGYTRGGCLASIGLGFIGALLGTFIARWLGLPEIFAITLGGKTFPIIWSILGSTIFVALLHVIQGRRLP
jgi:uncharacterized membrane protein YeaQ/YmgE (transglycosylase-associated protein family)